MSDLNDLRDLGRPASNPPPAEELTAAETLLPPDPALSNPDAPTSAVERAKAWGQRLLQGL